MGPLIHDQHACFILAAGLRLQLAEGTWIQGFLRKAEPSAIAPVIKDMPVRWCQEDLLVNNLLSESQMAVFAKDLAKGIDWTTPRSGIHMIHLANPLIAESQIEELIATVPSKSPALAALMANKNCPSSHQRNTLPRELIAFNQEALAMYGDLTKPDVLKELNEILHTPAPDVEKKKIRDHREKCMRHLIERTDLPVELVKTLDAVVPPPLYEELTNLPIHRELVKSGGITGVNASGPSGDWKMVLSQEMTKESVDEMFNDPKFFGVEVQRVLAAHRAASPEMIVSYLRVRESETAGQFATALVANQNPYAESALIAIRRQFPSSSFPENLGTLKNVSSGLLMKAMAEAREFDKWDEVALLASNKNFSSSAYARTLPDLKSNMPKEHLMALEATRAINSGISPEVFDEAMTSLESSTAMLFSPSISSRRLSKLAEAHPAATALAAIHPNGFAVETSSLPPETHVIVEKIRCIPLAGQSSAKSGSNELPVLAI